VLTDETQPVSIWAGEIRGSFFATTLGAPALEVRTPAESAERYKALYTDALVDCLSDGFMATFHDIAIAAGLEQQID